MSLNNNNEDIKSTKLVVRVDQDSDSDLQALFDSVLKPDSKRPLTVPLRMRKLPNSFFNPPSTGSKSSSVSHSHENSADSAFGSPSVVINNSSNVAASVAAQVNSAITNAANENAINQPNIPLAISHGRAHSSPATLQQTYAVNSNNITNATSSPLHIKQRSYDIGNVSVEETLGPLPPGWEQARTNEGQIYYLNHITRTTTWEDPRKTLAAMRPQHQSADQLLTQNNLATQVTQPVSGKGSTDPLGSLPEGWEQAQTSEGEIYFINHLTRTTSWFDPRIPAHLQRNPALNAMLPQIWLNNNLPQQEPTISLHAGTKLRLQSLKIEREMLKQRQQEIRRQQELMLRQPTTDLNLDPFLSGLTEHTRQESADSGLGLGTTYSLPQTPEDFLDDKMDCASEAGTVDTTSVLSTVGEVIDNTDDLVPSLQLGEEFSTDILDDVQSYINPNLGKPDNVLTWL